MLKLTLASIYLLMAPTAGSAGLPQPALVRPDRPQSAPVSRYSITTVLPASGKELRIDISNICEQGLCITLNEESRNDMSLALESADIDSIDLSAVEVSISWTNRIFLRIKYGEKRNHCFSNDDGRSFIILELDENYSYWLHDSSMENCIQSSRLIMSNEANR